MRDFQIREYRPQDFPNVVDLINQFQDFMVTLDVLGDKKSFSSKTDAERYVEQALKDVKEMNGAFFVAEKNDSIIGFVYGVIITNDQDVLHTLTHNNAKEGWVGIVMVDVAYQKQGLGTLLLQQIKTYFKQNGCTSMRLIVDQQNTQACHLYEQLGFITYEHKMSASI